MDRAALELVLQSTTAAEMRDRELLQWLRSTEEWLPIYGQQIDICLHVIRILCTFPWNRFASSEFPSPTSKKTVTKIVLSFERICCTLVSKSAQLMVPVLEAALEPFAVLGVRNAVPIDTITRIINHCATAHPKSIPQLFNQALDPLCPPKRWSSSFHHEVYMIMLLNLALEAQLPAACSMVGNFRELTALYGGTSSYGTSSARIETPMSPPVQVDSSTNRSETDMSGAAHSAGAGRRTSGLVSNEEGSDVGRGSGIADTVSLQLSGHNRLMSSQVRIIGLVLQKLLEMEMSIEYEDAAIEEVVDERRQRKRARKERGLGSSSGASSYAAEQFSYEQQDPNGYESPIHMVRMCVARVFDRLECDMHHRRLIGACDRPAWWTELQAFHVECVSKIKNPIALHFLAPSLATLGVAGEATELTHKVVSAVLKGACERRPSALQAAAMANAQRQGGRMIPPPQSDKLNAKQRVLASLHIFPLFAVLWKHLPSETCEGLLRRLFKFVGTEGSSTTGADSVVDSILGQALCMCRMLHRGWDEQADIPDEVKQKIMRQFQGVFNTTTSNGGHKSAEDAGVVASLDAAALDKICDAQIESGKVRPDLYTHNIPWSNKIPGQLPASGTSLRREEGMRGGSTH